MLLHKYTFELLDVSNCKCETCDDSEHMEEDGAGPSNVSSSSSSTLSPTERRQRDRKSEALRNDQRYSSNELFHAAMLTHKELGNETAARIHKKLMDDPNSMDDWYEKDKAKKPTQKLSSLQVYFEFLCPFSSFTKIQKGFNIFV